MIQFSIGWDMGIDPRLAMYALGSNQYQLINDKRGQMFAVFIEVQYSEIL